MKLVVTLLVGLAIGYLLTLAGDIMPEPYRRWVGLSVAGSETVVSGLQLLPLSSDALRIILAWIIVLAIQFVPLLGFSLIAVGVYLWSQRARPLIYGPMVFPLCLFIVALYTNRVFAHHDAVFAHTFRNFAVQHFQTYIMSYIVFVLLFALLSQTAEVVFRQNKNGSRASVAT